MSTSQYGARVGLESPRPMERAAGAAEGASSGTRKERRQGARRGEGKKYERGEPTSAEANKEDKKVARRDERDEGFPTLKDSDLAVIARAVELLRRMPASGARIVVSGQDTQAAIREDIVRGALGPEGVAVSREIDRIAKRLRREGVAAKRRGA
jgi:hypothetical protein